MPPQTTDTADQLALLYEQNYTLWLDATSRLLKTGRLSDLDLSNLLEELEDYGAQRKTNFVQQWDCSADAFAETRLPASAAV